MSEVRQLMNDYVQRSETQLRRKLLFRLLRDFDFDRPMYRSECISELVQVQYLNAGADVFEFKT